MPLSYQLIINILSFPDLLQIILHSYAFMSSFNQLYIILFRSLVDSLRSYALMLSISHASGKSLRIAAVQFHYPSRTYPVFSHVTKSPIFLTPLLSAVPSTADLPR